MEGKESTNQQDKIPAKQLQNDINDKMTSKDSEIFETSDSEWTDYDSDDSSTSFDLETKHLNFMPVDFHGVNRLERFEAFSRLKKLTELKSIVIDLTQSIEDWDEKLDAEIVYILNRILKSSSGCLEVLALRTPIGYLPGVIFPLMPKLRILELQFFWYGSDATNFTSHLRSGKIFPKGFKFSLLPKLTEVTIELETEGERPQYHSRFDCWRNNLKSCRIAKTVKQIHYNDDCGFSKQQLKITFPNAKWSKFSNLDTTCESSSEMESENDDTDDDSDDGSP